MGCAVMGLKMMNEPITIGGALPWVAKGVGAVVGGILALILGGYINPDGSFRITRGLILNLSLSVSISIYGGSAWIEYYELQDKTMMTHGFIMLLAAVFGMLLISVFYQAIALLRGKPLSVVVGEIAAAFAAVKSALFGGKQ